MNDVVLAIDFGGTKVEAALIDDTGVIVPGSRARAATGRERTSAEIETAVATVVRTALGTDGLATAARVAGSAVTHIRPQHFPSAACGAFAGPASLFSANGFAS